MGGVRVVGGEYWCARMAVKGREERVGGFLWWICFTL